MKMVEKLRYRRQFAAPDIGTIHHQKLQILNNGSIPTPTDKLLFSRDMSGPEMVISDGDGYSLREQFQSNLRPIGGILGITITNVNFYEFFNEIELAHGYGVKKTFSRPSSLDELRQGLPDIAISAHNFSPDDWVLLQAALQLFVSEEKITPEPISAADFLRNPNIVKLTKS